MNIGIVGAGGIAHKLAEAINRVEGVKLFAVASRSFEKARSFAEKHGASLWFGSYKELYNYPDVDLVYIATPNSFHKKHTLDAIEAGKGVLCEKPFALNYSESLEMINAAKTQGTFLAEAMWTKYFPAVKKVKDIVDSGALGDIVTIQGDLSYPLEDKERLYKKSLGGGALLDLGVYPVSLTHYFLGFPDKIIASSSMTEDGVDSSTSIILKYNSGAAALLSCSINAVTTKEFLICGTKGWIRLNDNLGYPKSISCFIDGVGEQHQQFPWEHLGYEYQIEGLYSDFSQGLKESSTVKLNDTLEIMKILDNIRAEIGLDFNE